MAINIINAKDIAEVSSSTAPGNAVPQPFEGLETTLSAAFKYHEHGFAVLPLPPESKKPKFTDWPNFTCAKEEIPKWFAGEPNIAVLLGEPSDGVVDVDLDTVEAVALAPDFLPPSACVFGRESRRASHYEYRVEGPTESHQWSITSGGEAVMLLEFRSTGVMTTFPPSTHSSGEVVEFEQGKAGLPENVSGEALISILNRLAAATAMVLSWPKKKGVRQSLTMALSGGLLRAGLSPDEVLNFITRVAQVAGDKEVKKRREAAEQTIKKHATGKAVTGWPKVADYLGPDGKHIVDRIRDWLGDIDNTEPSGKLDAVLASDITVREVEWLWPQRIAYGTITIIDGDPGAGKSTIALDFAARLSVGTELPGGGECDAAGVVVLTSEDAFGSTVVPRLKAAGANLNNINLVRGVKGSHGETELISIPENMVVLREAIHSVNARLVVIDPLIAFISLQAHAHNDQQIRRALAPLARLAEETGVAVLALRHLTKKPGTSALYRGGGSIGLIGAARTGLIVGKDPYDPTCRVLAMTKSNLGEYAPSLRYRIVGQSSSPGEEPWEASAIEWIGLSDVSADQLVAVSSEDKGGAIKDAVEFLREVLKDGPMMAKEVFHLAKEGGHTKTTLKRAAKELTVVKTSQHDGKNIVGWEWSLPLNAVPGVLVDEDAASESLQVENQHVH